MLYQVAKRLVPGNKIKELETGIVYVVERLNIQEHPMKVEIYAREEKTRKPKCFHQRQVEKYRLWDEIHS